MLRILIFFCLISQTLVGQRLLIEKSKSLFESGSYANAKSILKDIAKPSSEFAEAQYYLGRIATEEKQYELAITYFESAAKTNPSSAEYHNWLGVLYGVVAMEANPIKQAYLAPKIKNEFETAIVIEPTNIATLWGLVHYYTQAPGFLGGSWQKAFDCAKAMGKMNCAQGLCASGFVHAAQKQTALAEKEMLQAMKLDSTNFLTANYLAEFYEQEKQNEKAFLVYQKFLSRAPLHRLALFNVGRHSARFGYQTTQGIRCLNLYLTKAAKPNEPSHSNAALCLAMIYEKQGDIPMAKSYYQNSLRLEPGLKEAEERLKRLN